MAHTLKIFLIISFSLLFSLNTVALESDKNTQLTCFAKHLDTNNEVEVKIIPGIAGENIATAQWPLGYPTIVIDNSKFLKLPVNARQFIYYHECAHLKLEIKDEYKADCKSLA